jgi:hypothetical protein
VCLMGLNYLTAGPCIVRQARKFVSKYTLSAWQSVNQTKDEAMDKGSLCHSTVTAGLTTSG